MLFRSHFADEAHLRRTIDKIVSRIGRRVDESSPMVDARLPDGSRVNAIVPPLAIDGSALTIRKFSTDPLTVQDLINFGSLTPQTADFLDACANEASGNCSVIDAPWDFCGPYFWANGKSANTTDAADLDACEEFMVNTLGKHIKAFDSYPSTKIAEGAYSLAVAWTGDARQAYSRIADAGGTPENWKWVLPGPKTQLFMDTYAIPTGAPNPTAAHAWIKIGRAHV